MFPRRALPYAAILVAGQAVLDAGPAIIAEREGGMGLGSALIGALVTQIAGIVLGATVAGHVVDRRSIAAATLYGAFVYYVGLMLTGIAPMGSLGTVVAGMGLAGIGFGALLTAAFSVAAGSEARRERVAGIALLLAAPVAARVLVGTAFAVGPLAFVLAAAAVVALSLVAVNVPRAATRPAGPGAVEARGTGSAGRAVIAAVLLSGGTTLTVAGADPSRLSASLLVGTLGGAALASLDTARVALLAIGIVLLLSGAALLLAGAERVVRTAAASVLLVGVAGSGIVGALTQALTAGRVPDGTGVLVGAAAALGGWLGLATGAFLVGRARGHRLPAVAGSAAVAVACAVGWVALLGQRPPPGAVVPIALISGAGWGAGMAASALRAALGEVPPHRRGTAAAAGVVAAALGSAVGGLVGASEGLRMLDGTERGVAVSLAFFVVAAVGAVVVTASLPRSGGARPEAVSGEDSLSRSPE